MLCDGGAGLWRLQREGLPDATPVLDGWHVAVQFDDALQTARGLGVGTANACLVDGAVRTLDRAKWHLWHGRWPGCRRELVDLLRWTERRQVGDLAGTGRFQRHVIEFLCYLERNQDAPVPYAARRRHGDPISTTFVKSTVNEFVAKRMNKAQQTRWSKATVQPSLDVRAAVLNGTLENAFCQRFPGFWPTNDDQALPIAA